MDNAAKPAFANVNCDGRLAYLGLSETQNIF